MYKNDPISKVEWIEVDKLNANDYNPNVVLNSLLRTKLIRIKYYD